MGKKVLFIYQKTKVGCLALLKCLYCQGYFPPYKTATFTVLCHWKDTSAA